MTKSGYLLVLWWLCLHVEHSSAHPFNRHWLPLSSVRAAPRLKLLPSSSSSFPSPQNSAAASKTDEDVAKHVASYFGSLAALTSVVSIAFGAVPTLTVAAVGILAPILSSAVAYVAKPESLGFDLTNVKYTMNAIENMAEEKAESQIDGLAEEIIGKLDKMDRKADKSQIDATKVLFKEILGEIKDLSSILTNVVVEKAESQIDGLAVIKDHPTKMERKIEDLAAKMESRFDKIEGKMDRIAAVLEVTVGFVGLFVLNNLRHK
jgi:hypothetical protein